LAISVNLKNIRQLAGFLGLVPTDTFKRIAIAASTVKESSYWNSSHIQICSKGNISRARSA